eukprot:CAMPEP_0196772186 /NCGR_PEP_ID=MMETSP1104-20130614/2086_1 /TAXON_ID=33652 /ORGANISM="Cafeteria sp., Strain Caron Lab Isolate" /LENGTH=169 /DNA_ID=CAMNT_0042142319 /DNA_START=42 /DNA_END=552 /DNA_ORIENTATION=+
MLVPKKTRLQIYRFLFKEGVICAKKDVRTEKSLGTDTTGNEIIVRNLYVIKLLNSLKSRGYVRETFNWQWYYWFLTDEGIEYLREYLHLPADIIPDTLKKSTRPLTLPGPFGERGAVASVASVAAALTGGTATVTSVVATVTSVVSAVSVASAASARLVASAVAAAGLE